MRYFDAPDGTRYGVSVSNPGASNAIVVFRHPDGSMASRDRYAWYINTGPEARSVTARLFRRAMPVSTVAPAYNPAVASRG